MLPSPAKFKSGTPRSLAFYERKLATALMGSTMILWAMVPFWGVGEHTLFAKFIRQELGGVVWWVSRPGLVGGGHVSEHSLTADKCDRVIDNAGSRDQLRWQVQAAWREATQAAA